MARAPRIVIPGIAVHVIQRGNNRATCFRRDGDYLLYLLHLRELAERLACRVHAYCLMTNHAHLLLTPATADTCAVLMRNLGQRYVQHFNRAYERTGTLWEGRYRSCLVDSASYALACYRYIERNPVRAGMVESPRQYLWSSYRANAGLAPDPLLTPHSEYLALSARPAARHDAYRRLLEEELEASMVEEIRGAANGGQPLGTQAFRAAIEKDLGRSVVHARPGRPRGEPTAGAKEAEIGL